MTERLSPGDEAPDFTLPDSEGKDVSLRDFRGKSVVVYFYPAASTPGCTKQACDFRDNLAELNDAGYQVIGISPDKQAKLAKFVENEKLTFPMLGDPEKTVIEAWGAYGEKKNYGKTYHGRDPLDVRRRRRRQDRPRLLQRPRDRARGEADPRPRRRLLIGSGPQ